MSEKIGHYTIVSKLGRGGMGVVYKAHEESLNRYVAIKVLGDHLIEDPQFLARFTREAQSAAGLSHPNIVQIYFISEDAGRHYFVMEYVSGKPLDAIIRDAGRLDAASAAQIILQAAHGLAAAHDKNIIHRDIKPANLVLSDRGIVKIADFGLALPSEIQSRLTATGMLMGTPGYMAPEQCKGEQADHRTDLYALGVTLYEMLTGNVPFKAESPLVLLKQILEEPAPDVSTINPEVDREIVRILDRMIAKEREDRYQSAHDLIEDVEQYLSDRGVRPSTRTVAALVAVGAPVQIGGTDPTMALDGATTPKSAPGGSAAPTMATGAGAAATDPELESSAPPTIPAETLPPPPPAHDVATPLAAGPARSSSTSRLFLVLALLLFLLVAGGALAAFLVFRGGDGDELLPGDAIAEGSEPGDVEGVDMSSLELSAPVNTETMAIIEDEPESQLRQDSGADEPRSDQAGTAPRKSGTAAATPRTQPEPRRSEAAPSQPARSALQGVAVVVTGDAGLTEYVATALTSRFKAVGVDVVDARFLSQTEGLVRGDPSTGALVDALRNAGVRLMVLARVEPTGQRELQYMGRSDTAYSSRINISTIDVSNGRPLGQTRSESIEYTSLNAERQTQAALRRIGREVAEAIRER